MLLLPIFSEAWNGVGIKFLHVTRDGRDIAFSGNQSPVRKFYDTYYSQEPTDPYEGARTRNREPSPYPDD
jgi:hypothetical protein